jgi:hypothetical protein
MFDKCWGLNSVPITSNELAGFGILNVDLLLAIVTVNYFS